MLRFRINRTILVVCIMTIFFSGLSGFGGTYLAFKKYGSQLMVSPGGGKAGTELINYTTGQPGQLTSSQPHTAELTIPEIYELASDSVVEITTETVRSAGRLGQFISEGAGSGVVISSDGYIITNNHVIESASTVIVRLKNGQSYPAILVGRDNRTDIAVLKVDASDLQPAVFGDSSQLTVGEMAVAIGNPLGELGGTLTEGIISALDREIIIDGERMNLLQTSAAVNPGNSGGGLINSRGELIGIINAKSGGFNIEGLGFAIPVNRAIEVANEIIEHGYVTGRPALGVTLLEVADAGTALFYRLQYLGVYVYEVVAESDLQPGDRLIAIEGREIVNKRDVREAVEPFAVGDEVRVTIQREGERLNVIVTLSEALS